MHHDRALLKAIRYFGSQSALAKLLKVTLARINHWLTRTNKIPFEYAVAIEKLTDGEINRYEIAPYAEWLRELDQKIKSAANDKEAFLLSLFEEYLMSKIRTIKPELLRHEDLFEAEKQTGLPLRLSFMGLFTCCDRQGRFRWKPRQLKLDVLPYDEIDFEQILHALHTCGFIQRYEYNGEHYGYIPTWSKHQTINTREPESKLPDPNMCTHVQNNAVQVHAHLEVEMEEEMEKELEGEEVQEKGKIFLPVAQVRPREDISAVVENIFSYWKITLDHPNAKLDLKRRRLITQALKLGYTPEQLCHAISGCAVTPHNLGDNDRGQRYDGLHVILRDADQIDRFIRNYHNPPRPLTNADKKLKTNIHAAERWLNQQLEVSDDEA